MEPADRKVKYTINTTCTMVEERFTRRYIRGIGKDAEFQTVSLGWYAWFAGSYEMLSLGTEMPELKSGDLVKITIERRD